MELTEVPITAEQMVEVLKGQVKQLQAALKWRDFIAADTIQALAKVEANRLLGLYKEELNGKQATR